MRREISFDFRLALVLTATIASSVYTAVRVGHVGSADWFLSWAIASALWLCLVPAAALLPVAGPALFYATFYVTFVCDVLYAFYFEAAAERHFSLLDVDRGTVVFFFSRVLTLRGWAELALLLAGVNVVAWLASRRSRSLPSVAVAALALPFLTTTIAVAAVVPRAESPLLDVARGVRELFTTNAVRVDGGTTVPFSPSVLDHRQSRTVELRSAAFDKVLVFVMEGMTARKFDAERAALSPGTFVSTAVPHAHVYRRYYPNNQDSRTGMLDMLHSRVIPYEAYTTDGRDHYVFLSRKPSLVDDFNAAGYATAYAVSQTIPELVVASLPWSSLITLTESTIRARESEGQLCYSHYEFEHGCEDRAVLSQVLAFLDGHPKAFLYQEFIWGHDIAYNRASGQTDTGYYSSYVDAVLEHLESTGALERTLVVLTSDHGLRDGALQKEPWVYNIPLWFWAHSFEPRSDERLFSHIDLRNLVSDELAGRRGTAEQPFVAIVGPTGTGMTALLTRTGEFMLVKKRGERRLLLEHDGQGAVAPAGYLKLLDEYRKSFDAFGADAGATARAE